MSDAHSAQMNVTAAATKDEFSATAPPKDCPVDKNELGRNTWSFLHTMAAYYPEEPTTKQQKDMNNFIKLFSRFYPCDWCSYHMRERWDILIYLFLSSSTKESGLSNNFIQKVQVGTICSPITIVHVCLCMFEDSSDFCKMYKNATQSRLFCGIGKIFQIWWEVLLIRQWWKTFSLYHITTSKLAASMKASNSYY